jgi:hypothetical protein
VPAFRHVHFGRFPGQLATVLDAQLARGLDQAIEHLAPLLLRVIPAFFAREQVASSQLPVLSWNSSLRQVCTGNRQLGTGN